MYDLGSLLEYIVALNITPIVLVGLAVFINRPGVAKESKRDIMRRRVVTIILAILALLVTVYILNFDLLLFRFL